MPRLRFVSSQLLESFVVGDSGVCEHETELRLVRLKTLRAGRSALGTKRFRELFTELLEGTPIRELAKLQGISAATAWRRRAYELKRVRYAYVAHELHDGLKRNGGASIDIRSGTVPTSREGYLVSVQVYGRMFPRFPTAQSIFEWLWELSDVLEQGPERLWPGTWTSSHNGPYWCDLNRNFRSRVAAMAFGSEQAQDSIFDLAAGASIRLPRRKAA